MTDNEQSSEVAALTVELLSAYLSNNTVPSDALADLIRSTKAALTEDVVPEAAPVEAETFTPAVSARKSLASPDFIISLVDGKPYKTLKRHLSAHGLTPESYRTRYNLPASYPMVAPTYAAHRRAVAQKIGLGSRRLGTGGSSAKAGQSPATASESNSPKASAKATKPRANAAKASNSDAKISSSSKSDGKAPAKSTQPKRMARAPKGDAA